MVLNLKVFFTWNIFEFEQKWKGKYFRTKTTPITIKYEKHTWKRHQNTVHFQFDSYPGVVFFSSFCRQRERIPLSLYLVKIRGNTCQTTAMKVYFKKRFSLEWKNELNPVTLSCLGAVLQILPILPIFPLWILIADDWKLIYCLITVIMVATIAPFEHLIKSFVPCLQFTCTHNSKDLSYLINAWGQVS